ncbi:hypothetical protein BSKO_12007 [Bryopsis sp. KO-2023]|nr:hypothetical protein BSKO_12007 [Bryopsis sp. KO-2023]
MGSVRLPIVVSCLLMCFSVALVAAQECNPEDKVPYETPLNAEEFTPLLSLTVPESCGDFQLPELLVCQSDVNIQEGCCDQTCKDLFVKVENQCLSDIAALVCKEGFEKLIPILNNLARRCDDQYEELACSEAEGAGTAELTAAAANTTGADSGTTAEECTPPVVSDEPFNATALLPLATLAVPESCGNFSTTSLLGCQQEINIEEGCCAEQCKDVFAQISQKCVADLGHSICTAETGAKAFPIIQRLAKRCDENFIELSCEELAQRAAALSSPDPEDPFDLQDDEDVVDALDEGIAEPTNFFSNPNPGITPTTPTPAPEAEEDEASEESFGFFGSSPVSTTPEEPTPEPTAAEAETIASVDEDCTPPVEADEPVDKVHLERGIKDPLIYLDYFPQRLARRCDADYIDLSCKQLAERAGETVVESSSPSLDAVEEGSEECFVAEEVDANVDVSQISSILSEVDQIKCPQLNTTETFDCQEDITLKSGCCRPKCKTFLAEMEQECIDEISSTICESSSDDFFIL